MTSQSRAELSLSFGALKKILEGEELENITLQILGYKQIPGSNNNRFRLLLNDGVVLFPYAILATHLNNLIYENQLEKFTIFRLKEYEYSQLLANKKVIICIDIEILVPGSEVNEKVSEKDYNNDETLSGQEIFTPFPTLPAVRQVYFNAQPSTSYEQNWDIAPSNGTSPKNREEAQFSTVSSLSPYRNKWTIKARLSYKSPIHNYGSEQRQGKYFTFHLLDDSGEIRAVAFNENADKYYELLEIFKIYIITNADIKPSAENSPVKCDFEMTVNNHTKIEFYADDDTSIPKPVFNFKTINSLFSLPKDSYVDVIGVCYKISGISNVATKNKEMAKRTISLIDKSKKSIDVTLWGASAKDFSVTTNSVVVVKNAKLSSFDWCSLSITPMSIMYVNPNFHKTFELRAWFKKVGCLLIPSEPSDVNELTASPNWKTLADIFHIFTNPILNPNTSLYHTTKATIVMVKKDCMYQACSIYGCMKKVNSSNGVYKCEKCDIESSTFRWVYFLTFQIADFSGSQWVKAFNEVAEDLIGISSNDLNRIKTENNDKYIEILNNLNFKTFLFKLRSSLETYNGETNLKTLVLGFSPAEPLLCTKKLLNDIKNVGRLLYDH